MTNALRTPSSHPYIQVCKKHNIGVSNAPFVTDTNAWTKLGLKTALKEAVKQGAERIAWSTGEQQFDRWRSGEKFRKYWGYLE